MSNLLAVKNLKGGTFTLITDQLKDLLLLNDNLVLKAEVKNGFLYLYNEPGNYFLEKKEIIKSMKAKIVAEAIESDEDAINFLFP